MGKKLNVYSYSRQQVDVEGIEQVLNRYQIVWTRPSLFNLKQHGYGFLKNLFWYIFTGADYSIYTLYDGDKPVHFGYIIPAVYRFPFMKPDDIQIGPCFTYPEYRRKGVYISMLRVLITRYQQPKRRIWVYCAQQNTASKDAIEKVGFEFYSEATMSGLTKRICLYD